MKEPRWRIATCWFWLKGVTAWMWNVSGTWGERKWEASLVVLPPYNNKTPNPSEFLIGFQSIAKDLHS